MNLADDDETETFKAFRHEFNQSGGFVKPITYSETETIKVL